VASVPKLPSSVLLLHGWGGSSEFTWGRNHWFADIEAAGRVVWAPDLPGHGSGGGSSNPADYRALADDIWRRRSDKGPFDAIGFSLGAKLVLALAAQRPRSFRKLVLGGLGGNVFAPEKGASAVADALESNDSAEIPEQIRGFVNYARVAGNHPLAVAAVLRRPPNPVLTPVDLTGVKNPTLLVYGDRDLTALPAAPLLSALPNAIEIILRGVGHLDLPDRAEFRRAALDFVSH
jgi:pimeloyl-ACP methyl ester carboxylesterase